MPAIGEIRIWPLKNPHPKIAANGDFTIDDKIKIKFTLFKGPKGMFVGLPGKYSEKPNPETGQKKWYGDVIITDEGLRDELTTKVLSMYNKSTGNDTLSQGEAAGPTNQSDDDIPF